jgi:hypothetical protein
MLSSISWQDYLTAAAISAIIYYLVIGIRYYREDLTKVFSGQKNIGHRSIMYEDTGDTGVISIAEKTEQSEFVNEELDEVEHLIERLKKLIADTVEKGVDEGQFKNYLGLLFQEYPALKTSMLRSSINELVASECEKYGTVAISESEVEELWMNS